MITALTVKQHQDELAELERQRKLDAVKPYEEYIDKQLLDGKLTIVIDGSTTPHPRDMPTDFIKERYKSGGWNVDAANNYEDLGPGAWGSGPINKVTLTFKQPVYHSTGYGQ